jgi:signal transduction histidine kinase
MSIGQYGKSAEDWGRLSGETSRRLLGRRTPEDPETRRGKSIRALSQDLLRATTSDQNGALAKTIEVLAERLGADRIRFYLSSDFTSSSVTSASEHRRFWLCSNWLRSGSYLSAASESSSVLIELDSFPEKGARLSRGDPLEMGSRLSRELASTSSPTRWSRSQASLYLPCLGQAGLLGFFRIENRLVSRSASGEVLDQSSLIATLFAGFLERQRLSILLDESQKKQGQNERLEKLGLLTSSVAHDFNNYLTAILGYADLAEMEMAEQQGVDVGDQGPGQSELSEIRNAATAAAELVEQILCSARNKNEIPVSLNLSDSIGEMKGMLAGVLGDGIALDLQLDDLEERVLVGGKRLERALLNLASNAREAILDARPNVSLGRRRFELSTTVVDIGNEPEFEAQRDLDPGRYVRISARDDGCGIAPENRARIFERFYTTREAGTGLGLASLADFMTASGGAIRVESTPSVGTVFHLYFPVDRSGASGVDVRSSETSIPARLV